MTFKLLECLKLQGLLQLSQLNLSSSELNRQLNKLMNGFKHKGL